MSKRAEKEARLQQRGERNARIIELWGLGRKRGVIARELGVTVNVVMGVVFRWQQRTGKGRRCIYRRPPELDNDIMRRLALGYTRREVADALGITIEEVKYVRRRERLLSEQRC